MEAILIFANILESHFAQLTDRLARFSETSYSFEEWFSWEVYHALVTRDYECSPKPMYSNYGGIHEKRLGDFRTKIKGNELFCEVKLVHDYTANKWISEINKDTVALQKVTNATAVQILLCVSNYQNLFENSAWRDFLIQLDIDKRPCTDINLSLPNGGHTFIKICAINTDQ